MDARDCAQRMLAAMLLGLVLTVQLPAADDFDTIVAPLLSTRCLSCHNKSEHKGGLDLSGAKAALAGGDSGETLVAGKPDESLLWDRISQDEMPPKKPLSAEEKQILKDWIAGGAKWGTDPIDPFRYSSDARAGYDWWSLRPVHRPAAPATKESTWPAGDIDRFLLAKLESEQLAPSSKADRRTLIRRLSFDLTGLPPTVEEIDAFISDEKPDAYQRLVERLLESTHYGERWGRHWLDIVRFGESQGFERDKLRTTSWPYRDWVIEAFNRDMPYDEFVRLQLAGDILAPDDPQGVIAAGFITAGPWDEVGQLQQSAAMRAVVRQDELEDVIGVTCQTFLGLTANCARCHDHKFDPILQSEYYQIAAVFAGTRHGEREMLTDVARTKLSDRTASLQAQLSRLETALEKFDAPVRARVLADRRAAPPPVNRTKPLPIAQWEFDNDFNDSVGELHGKAHGQANVVEGRLILDGVGSYVETPPLAKPLGAKTLEVWVSLARGDQRGGGAMSVESSSGAVFDAIVFGERDPGQWMAGSNVYARTQSFQAATETSIDAAPVQIVLVYGADRSITAYRQGQLYGQPYIAANLAEFEASKSHILFGLRHNPPGGDRFLAAAIDKAALYDRALGPDEVAALAGVVSDQVTVDQLWTTLSPAERAERNSLLRDVTRVQAELRLLWGGKTYTVKPSAPEPTHVLERGNPGQKAELVAAGAIRSVEGPGVKFDLPTDAPEGERRRLLAEWITDPRNPLTPRVIVNRVWHYHFGAGLVDTPNDFGFNGSRPTHPELLDWLAAELLSPATLAPGETAPGPWSLKHLHRLIVHSAAYRQAAGSNPAAQRIDAQNRWLWRKTPQRLEAEAVRDAMLAVSGELNPAMGGPGFQDFRTFTFNSQFYEMLDPEGFDYQRRTVYRTWVRSGRSEFLDVFDCPDPSTTSPRRAVTTTPLQALALLNNSFTLRMADKFAARIAHAAGNDDSRKVTEAWRMALGRKPTAAEQQGAEGFVRSHGLPALCRILFNSNEFLYID